MSNSTRLFAEAKRLLPGGVNSPVRSFSKVGGQPLFIKKAKGPFLFDEDGTKFIDYIGSWGPMILGHADDSVISSVKANRFRPLIRSSDRNRDITCQKS